MSQTGMALLQANGLAGVTCEITNPWFEARPPSRPVKLLEWKRTYVRLARKGVRRMAAKKPTKSTDHRDAGTGRFVTEKYADKHKGTTIKETRKK
jgi:hypothetical protein